MGMSVLVRFKNIMTSNFRALLEQAEDPEKMLAQYMREVRRDLGMVQVEMATIMAAEQRAKRALDECSAEVNKMHSYAKRALELGNEADARNFLDRKVTLAVKEAELKDAYEIAAVNVNQVRAMHDKLQSDINELESRANVLKAKLSVTKAQEKINQFSSSSGVSDFGRMEEKVNMALYKAEAMAELNAPNEDLDQLMAKYNQQDQSTPTIEDELEALKKSLEKK
jgi:phage shock protein A